MEGGAQVRNNWVEIFLASMAVIFGGIAFGFGYRSHLLLSSGGTAAGTVVRMEYSISTGKHSSGVYYPIVRFQSADGELIEARGGVGSSPPHYHAGDVVQILYDKKNPRSWTIDDWEDLYLFPAIFGAVATVLAIISCAMIYCKIRGIPFPGTYQSGLAKRGASQSR